jgi:hypothetical protein
MSTSQRGNRNVPGSLSSVYGPCTPVPPALPSLFRSVLWTVAGSIPFVEQDTIPIERVCEVQERCGDALLLLAEKDDKGESSERWQSNMVPVYMAERNSLIWVKKEHEKEYSAPSA